MGRLLQNGVVDDDLKNRPQKVGWEGAHIQEGNTCSFPSERAGREDVDLKTRGRGRGRHTSWLIRVHWMS